MWNQTEINEAQAAMFRSLPRDSKQNFVDCPSCGHCKVYRPWENGGYRWHCFRCGASGDGVSYVSALYGMTRRDAFIHVMENYGPGGGGGQHEQQRHDRQIDNDNDKIIAPSYGWVEKCQAYCERCRQAMPRSEGESYLTNVRKLSRKIIRRFRLGFDAKAYFHNPKMKYPRAAVIFPNLTDFDYYWNRFLTETSDGQKTAKLRKDVAGSESLYLYCAPALYSKQTVLVTESCLDCLSAYQSLAAIGVDDVGAVSLSGCQNHGGLLRQLQQRPTKARLVILFDDDKYGRDGAGNLHEKLVQLGYDAEVADPARIGRHDLNDALVCDGDIMLGEAIARIIS